MKKRTFSILIPVILIGFFVLLPSRQAIAAGLSTDPLNNPSIVPIYSEPDTTSVVSTPTSASTNNTAVANTAKAAAVCTGNGLGRLICQIQQILNSIIPILVLLGIVYFVWGVVQYVIFDDEEAKKRGRDRIIFGIIGLAVIVGLWGLVNLVVGTFGLSSATAPSLAPVTGSSPTCTSIDSKSTFQNLLCYITGIISNSVIPLIFALATVMFVWGVVQFFILNADEEAKRAQGKQFMIWGIVALAVMLSVWGLVGILGNTFGISPGSALPAVHPPS